MQFGIGQPNPRTEDPKLVRGLGCYADDVSIAGQVYGFALRSPHAHADSQGDPQAIRRQQKSAGPYSRLLGI